MKIEDAIKQAKFENEHQKVAINIMFTNNWVTTHQSQVLKPHNISIQQYNILRILRGQHPKPCTINLLINRMLDKNSNASRLVEKLRLKNLVERTENKKDRRQVDIIITQEGLDLLSSLDETMKNLSATILNITEEEAHTLNLLLDKLRSNDDE